jgi:two-component system sensor histidine kinase RegB
VTIKSDEKFSEILIQDDGPGFPEDIIDKLGEPYIRTSSNEDESKTGLGLGTFIGKTLLEKNNAKVEFKNVKKNKGALVKIVWLNENLKKI